MNIKSARKVEEFCKIVKVTGQGVIVKVPGHSGRTYYVKIECGPTIRVTCRHSNADGGKACSGNQISNTICYHAAAALEFYYKGIGTAGKLQVLAWASTEIDAEKAARLINGKVSRVVSTQGNGETWLAVRQTRNQGQRSIICQDIAAMCAAGSDKVARDKAMIQQTSNSRTDIFK